MVTVQWGNAGQSLLSVVETDEFGCSGTAVSLTVLIGSSTGIIAPQTEQLVSVYPNPTNGDFKIKINGYNGKFEAEIFDVTGRILTRGSQKQMSLKEYPDGLYFLRVYFDDKVQDLRLIKN